VYDVPTQYQVMSPTTVYHPPFFLNLLTFDRLTLIHNVGNMISSGKRVNTIKIYYVKYGNPIGATKNVRHDRLRWMWVEGMIIIASCPRSPSRTFVEKPRRHRNRFLRFSKRRTSGALVCTLTARWQQLCFPICWPRSAPSPLTTTVAHAVDLSAHNLHQNKNNNSQNTHLPGDFWESLII